MSFTGRIYLIRCNAPESGGKAYVGQTIKSLAERWANHVYDAHRGEGHCRRIGNAIRKYGADAFVLSTLETIEAPTRDELADRLDAAEAEAIRSHGTLSPDGYNLRAGGSGKGAGVSAETRRRMSEALRGRTLSDAARRRISEVQRGKTLTAEHRRKVSLGLTGRPVSEETRRRISDAQKGRPRQPQSKESRRKAADALRGRKRPAEVGAKISAALTGKKLSPEHCARISESHKGYRPTPEAIEKTASALRGRQRPPEVLERISSTSRQNRLRERMYARWPELAPLLDGCALIGFEEHLPFLRPKNHRKRKRA